MAPVFDISVEIAVLQVIDEMTGDVSPFLFLLCHLINSWPLGVSDGIICGVLHFGHALYLEVILQSE